MIILPDAELKRPWSDTDFLSPEHILDEKGRRLPLLEITRMAPGDRSLQLGWSPLNKDGGESVKYAVEYRASGTAFKRKECYAQKPGKAAISGLSNGRDYEVAVKAIHKHTGRILAKSRVRLARPGKIPGTVINYIHPDDYTYGFSGRSPASPSIAMLPNGNLVASHDVYWGGSGQNLSMIFCSRDKGKTWEHLTNLYPCFWGKLFVHRGALYILATSTEYGSLLIGRSADGGRTWSRPTVIIEGGSREEGGPHKAPMPVVEHNGRLWSAIDYGSWSTGGHDSGVVSVPADADLLEASSWEVTSFLAYDDSWPGTVSLGHSHLLEGNVVVTPEGELVNILRYHTTGSVPNYGKAIILDIDRDRPSAPLRFNRVIDFHGNMSKFAIARDPVSERYWALVNRVSIPWPGQRNILTLVSSQDLSRWDVVCDLLNYQDNDWPEGPQEVGFQYPDFIIAGENILAVSRTALNGAYNRHNANHLTFHRIENFRKGLGTCPSHCH